jgi:hypothetical protein
MRCLMPARMTRSDGSDFLIEVWGLRIPDCFELHRSYDFVECDFDFVFSSVGATPLLKRITNKTKVVAILRGVPQS